MWQTKIDGPLSVARARFPAEVYNRDEDALLLSAHDDTLSELARGLRYARRQVQTLPSLKAERYRTWLDNAGQLPRHLERGSLFIDPLKVEDLPHREALMRTFGIDLGEAACLVLAARSQVSALFLSADEAACRAAQAQGIPYLTLLDVLEAWVRRESPSPEAVESLVSGMKEVKYGPSATFVERLTSLL